MKDDVAKLFKLVLDPQSLGLRPGGAIMLYFWARLFSLSAPLHPKVQNCQQRSLGCRRVGGGRAITSSGLVSHQGDVTIFCHSMLLTPE